MVSIVTCNVGCRISQKDYFLRKRKQSCSPRNCRASAYATDTFDIYVFEKSLQGDIIAIYDDTSTKVVTYTYDAWGNTTVEGAHASTIGALNPFRYRGYYFDNETSLYYLQSRYYNSTWGRFLNADGYINANGDIIGYNMFAYCSNNPINYMDARGFAEVAIREAWEFGMWWLVLADGVLPIGDLIYLLGCVMFAVSAGVLIENMPVSAAAVGIVFAETEDDDAETENKELPNQGDVSEIADAPPVDAGKQGKHVPGHNNNDPRKSQWRPGETGVKETQEAWRNGTDVPGRNGTVRIGESSVGRVIKVHIDQAGKIHGYPIP